MSYGEMGKGSGTMIWICFIALCIAGPLAIWKAVELLIWVCRHVTITTN